MKSDRHIQHGPNGTYLDITKFSTDDSKQGAHELLIFENNGGDIASTNYFDSTWGKAGMYFLTGNAGIARLLIPDSELHSIPEMKTGKFCVITSGLYMGQPSLEIMFDDLTRAPFAMHMPQSQCDFRIQGSRKPMELSAWTRSGKVGQWRAFQRTGKNLPCLQPWK